MSAYLLGSIMLHLFGRQRLDRQDGASFNVSGDQRFIAFTSGQTPHNGLFLVDRKSGHIKELTPKAGFYSSPAFSPDGKTLAFSFGSSGTDKHQILLMDLAATKVRPLYTDGSVSQENASFSPDGKWIAYAAAARRRDYAFGGKTLDNYDLYVKHLGASKPIRITSASAFEMLSPSWSSDGHQLMVEFSDPYPAHTMTVLIIDAKSHKTVRRLRVDDLTWGITFAGKIAYAILATKGALIVEFDVKNGKVSQPLFTKAVTDIRAPFGGNMLFLLSPTGNTLRYTVFEFNPKTRASKVVLPEPTFDRRPSK